MLNPDLIDFDSRDEDNGAIDEPIGPIASASVPNAFLPLILKCCLWSLKLKVNLFF